MCQSCILQAGVVWLLPDLPNLSRRETGNRYPPGLLSAKRSNQAAIFHGDSDSHINGGRVGDALVPIAGVQQRMLLQRNSNSFRQKRCHCHVFRFDLLVELIQTVGGNGVANVVSGYLQAGNHVSYNGVLECG